MRLAPGWLDARTSGGALCAAGLVLVALPSLLAAAAGVELLAAAFWCWARAAADAPQQVPRWGWLRRPATALWLAVAIHAATPGIPHAGSLTGVAALMRWLEAIAVVWAGLELMAALPLARPYSDLRGPLLAVRPWLPVMLPAAGFAVLWRHAPHWIDVAEVRHAAVPLLLLTALLGALRAFARRQWTASLRWLAVTDSALAGLLVARGTVAAPAAGLLWLAACGGHAFLLAGELRGAVTRRGAVSAGLWRAASWTSLAALSWPALVAAGGVGTGALGVFSVASAALAAALAAWITVGRMVAAPERRRLARSDPALTLSRLAALLVMAMGPAALALAWWTGFEPEARASVAALAPAVVGGAAAAAARRGAGQPLWRFLGRLGGAAPALAGLVYRAVVAAERRVVALAGRALAAIASPLHDLHTGDAQEYLLFLVGLGILAAVLPLLQ